ncbi:serine phosphatase RsbU (regulator of sigma subunit) [Umezawaea tangerina]|uniref:Serine phosphatase RsbU (Regulator of sigma subunit) n=1 Tax=Umezawaea tangerina TaxID=84725 RepID=A0A2T0SV45_9PSEU|nr:serine phosphatase RsbU (regulator of sigma subunit) [Umezawaea tangerina]
MAQGHRVDTDAPGIDLGGWRRLVDGLREAVVVLDPDDTIALVNHAATELYPTLAPGLPLTAPGRRQALGDGWTACYLDDPATWDTAFLDEALRRLSAATDRAATLTAIVELGLAHLADQCAVIVPALRGRVEWWYGAKGAGEVVRGRTTRQSAGVVTGLLDVLDGVVRHAEFGRESTPDLPVDFGEPGSAHAVPLIIGGTSLGALVLVRRVPREPFTDVEVESIRRYGDHAARALEAAIRHGEQARVVEVLRADLLPSPLPEVPGALLAAAYHPAARRTEVGGDFYDVHVRQDGTATFVLGDVCGNGLEAAVHSGRVRRSLHTLLLVEQRPAQLLYLLNAALVAAGSKLFTTLVVGTIVQLDDGGLRLTVSSGGHPPPILLHAGGTVEEVVARGGIVGVLSDVRFQSTSVVVKPGETLLMYTDGITEARAESDREELFGEDRLQAVLRECTGLRAEAAVDTVRRAVFDWLGPSEHDDITLLAIQAAPTG